MRELVEVALQVSGTASLLSSLQQVSGAAGGAGGGISGVITQLLSFKNVVAGLATGALASKITGIGSAFENTQNRMAGTLTALGQTDNFTNGLSLAANLMQQINLDAAKLPGEAEQYVQVFTQALPQLQEAVGGGIKNMTAFSNRMTAIGVTLGIDAMQIARDTQLMLRAGQGGAGMDVRTFTTMLPFMKQVAGQANLTRESFNKMTSQDRAKLLTDTFAKLQPMLDNASNSWDAVTGATTSIGKELFRMSTAPIFGLMKSGLSAFNNLIMDSEGNFTKLGERILFVGQFLSTSFVEGAKLAGDALAPIGNILSGISFGGMGAMGSDIGAAFNNLAGIVNSLSQLLMPMVSLYGAYEATLMDLYTSVMPGLTSAIWAIIDPLVQFGLSIMESASFMLDYLRPFLGALFDAMGGLLEAVGNFLGPILVLLADIFGKVFRAVALYLMPAFSSLIEAITSFVKWLTDMLNKLGDGISAANAANGLTSKGTAPNATGGIMDFFKNIGATVAAKRAQAIAEATGVKATGAKTPKARGGASLNQDFRFSRFEIQQKFAEGFDPDRISIAFERDLGKAGEQKLSSGLEPLFSSGARG